MRLRILLSFLLFILNISAQSSVYKVTGKGTTMYLGGTIHILKESDFPLPKEYDEAYLKSSLIIFETKINEEAEKELGQLMVKLSRYEEGKSLKTELNKENYKNLEKAFEKAGMSIKMFEKTKPMMAILCLP